MYSGNRTVTGETKLIEAGLCFCKLRLHVAESPSFAALVDQCQPDRMHIGVCTRALHRS